MIDRQQLVETVVEHFPSLEEDIRDETWAGLVHLEVSSFARYTQQQIDSGNRPELKRCFDFARQFILEGTEDVREAMAVSYVEHLNLRDQRKQRSWALEEMPEAIRRVYEELFPDTAA